MILFLFLFFFFFFKQKTAYEITVLLEFRRVLFRSRHHVLLTYPAISRGQLSPGYAGTCVWPEFQSEVRAPHGILQNVLDCSFVHCLSMLLRSEERRVGKECRSRWSRYH